ncbi:MAG: SurA N-terminal domain-containing protein, partial [Hyphomicrobiales bacterium]
MFNGISVSVARWTGFGPQDLATVGDVVISSSTYQNDLKQKLAQVQRQTGGNPLSLEDARKLGIDKQVFDLIINNAVLDATVEKMGLRISDKQIADPIAANPSFQTADGKFDPNLFRQALEQNGMNEATFFAEQRQTTSRAYVMGLATSGQPVPKVLTEALLRYQNETRDGRYFTFSVSEKDVAAPTDEELKKQYEATPAAYTAPEYRSVAVMKVEPADVASRLSVTPEELQAGYDNNKLDYFKPEVRTIIQASFPNVDAAKAAKARVDAGEDLLKIAMEGGAKESDVTFADRTKGDFLDSKIGDAAFALAEGKVSDPVQGALNTVLLKAVKVTPEHQPTLDEIKDALTKRLQLDKARDEIQSIYDAVEDARAQQTKFEDIASKAGIPFILAPAVSAAGQDKDGKDVNLPEKPQLLKSVFETDVGVENDALSANDGYIWYEVREVVPSALKP